MSLIINLKKKNYEKGKCISSRSNGTTGRIIIDLLKESNNYNPVAMVRKKEQKEDFEKNNVSAILADLEEDLSHTTKNVQKVIFAAGSKGKNVIGVDQEGAKKLTDAAKNSGASKFVMLSSMGADNPSASEDLQDYLKAKQNGYFGGTMPLISVKQCHFKRYCNYIKY